MSQSYQFDDTVAHITGLLFVPSADVAADLALILGAPNTSSADAALSLYQRGLTRHIMITGRGATPRGPEEWRMMESYLLSNGVDPRHIWLEKAATNTLENMRLSAALIETAFGWDNVRSVALCCKPLHARRALLTARTIFPPGVALSVACPRHPGDLQPETWWRTDTGISRVMGELQRIGEYTIKGDIDLRASLSRD